MMKCPVPLLLLLLLGVIDPIGSNTGIGQLLAQGGPNNPPPEPPQPIDPPTITSQSTSAFITPGTDVTFEVVAEGNGPLDYQWFFNGSSIRNERKQQLTIRNFQADEVGTYFVVVSNPGGFVRSANINPILRQERSTGIGFRWVSRFEPLQSGFHRPNDLVTDRDGNTYVVGEVPNGEGNADFVIIKYDKDGRELWSRLRDPSEGNNDRALAVQVHPNGDIIVLGTSNARQPGTGTTPGNLPQIELFSFNQSGEQNWSTRLESEAAQGAEAADLAIDPNGNILVTGTALGPQNQDILTASLSVTGDNNFPPQLFDGGGRDTGASIASDRSGNIFVVGTSSSADNGDNIRSIFYNRRGTEIWTEEGFTEGEKANDIGTTALFDNENRPIAIGAIGNKNTGLDFNMTRFSPSGNVQFSRSISTRGNVNDIPVNAGIDTANNILIAGNSLGNNQASEAMLAKITQRNTVEWVRILPAAGRSGDTVNDLTIADDGGPVIAGAKLNQPFGTDMINVKLDRTGNQVWDVRFSFVQGEMIYDAATAIDIDPQGDILMAGISNSQASGDGTALGTDTQLITIKQQISPPTQNTLPTVSITQPSPGARYEFEQEISIFVTANDFEGPVEKVEILVGDKVIRTLRTAPFNATWIVDTVDPILITARVTDSDGAVVSAANPVEVIVTDIRPEIVSFPSDQIVAPGGTLTLAAEVTGRDPIRYVWSKNNKRLKDADGPILVIENFRAEDAGLYELRVENQAGRDRSQPISIELDVPTVIAGDNFADRVSLAGESGQVKVSNVGATRETGEPLHANKRSNHSVWFSYVAGAQGLVEISTVGANFDTLLAVYTGTTLGNIVEITNDEDRGGFLTSSLQFKAEADQEYIILVDGFNQHEGTAILTWSLDRTRVVDVPRFSVQPAERVARPGSQVVFNATLQGPRPPGIALQWFFNGEAIENETSPQLRVDSIDSSQVGRYWVEATIGNVTAISDHAVLTLAARRAINALVIPEVKIENKFADIFFSFAGANAQGLQQQRRRPIRLAASLATGYSGAQIFNTFGAVKELGEPDHCDVPGGASQWFAYQPPADGVVGITTDGSDFDTVIAVYTTASSDFSSLTEVACDNDSGVDGFDSTVTFDATANTIYYVAVDGVEAATGVVELAYAMELPLEMTLSIGGGLTYVDGDTSNTVSQFVYSITAAPNVDFVVESSLDLETWSTVITAQAGPDGTYQFEDDQFSLENETRYFRVFYP